jgi:alkaline phosphatase
MVTIMPNRYLRNMSISKIASAVSVALVGLSTHATAQTPTPSSAAPELGNVIFIHPDGAGANTWGAARLLAVGPDNDLHWDKLPHIALYRGHMADSLVGTSNGGATTHAFGVKTSASSFGASDSDLDKTDLLDASGQSASVAMQAIREGLPVGLINTGIAPEPGSAAFVATVARRDEYEQIALELIESNADVLLSGGEKYFVPVGTKGVYGPGSRRDQRDLIQYAKDKGYTVVRTREELLALPDSTSKVLGLFSWGHTFNDASEEDLRKDEKQMYQPEAPTVAQMTNVALRILNAKNKRFLLVVEEEGTDNFGNANNAIGVLTAAMRADEAIGVARQFVASNPKTLVITTADSDAGGMQVLNTATPDQPAPEKSSTGGAIDGVDGAKSKPFIAKADKKGDAMPFFITWSQREDCMGGMLVRGEGLNAEKIRGSMDNSQIAPLIRLTLFGEDRPVVKK